MPTLAVAKRRTGFALGSRTLVADSTETAFCAWTSATALLGGRAQRGVRLVAGRAHRCACDRRPGRGEGLEAWETRKPTGTKQRARRTYRTDARSMRAASGSSRARCHLARRGGARDGGAGSRGGGLRDRGSPQRGPCRPRWPWCRCGDRGSLALDGLGSVTAARGRSGRVAVFALGPGRRRGPAPGRSGSRRSRA
jgi:hypothetical protein